MVNTGQAEPLKAAISTWLAKHTESEDEGLFTIQEAFDKLLDDHPWQGKSSKIMTGIRPLDEWTKGGLRATDFGICMAPTGHGKSAILMNIALHAAWIENGVRGHTGCGVLVATLGGRPVGFFLLEEDPVAPETLGFGVGTLSLIAVDAAARRRGVGAALSRAALFRLRERGQRYAEVGTQLANLPASNLYLRAGFRLVGAQVTLRWLAEER